MRAALLVLLLLIPQTGRAENTKPKEKPKDFQQAIREFEAQAQKENPEKVAEQRLEAARQREVEKKANDAAISAMLAQYPPSAKTQETVDKIQQELKQGQYARCEAGSPAACAAYEGRLFGNPADPADIEEGEEIRPPQPLL